VTTSATEQAVQTTGWLTAAVRAREYLRADAYLADPYARALVTDDAVAQLDGIAETGVSTECVVVRVRLGDEIVRGAAARGVRQAVGLGAGSDTRPYRLQLPAGFRFFELDLPGQIATKHGRLAEAGFTPVHDVFSVEGDLRADFAPGLLAAGFAPDQPCVWFAEGLLQYLEPPAVNALIHQVSALSADGSEFFFDVMHEEYANDPAHVRVAALMQELGVQISLAPADGPMRWLAGHGWTAVTYAETDLLVGACPLIPPLPARLAVDPRMIRYVHATNSPLSRHPAAAA